MSTTGEQGRMPDRSSPPTETVGTERTNPAERAWDVDDSSPPALLDRYVLEEEIGRGAASVVHAARDRITGQRVALKLVRASQWQVQRFLAEVWITSQVRHAHVVRVHGAGVSGGWCFIAMDLIDGPTLAHRVAREGGRLGALALVRLLVPIVDALAHAHQRGIVHRDIKPANILIGPGDTPFLTDFGVAIDLWVPGASAGRRPERLVGTPAFMAPEQALGGRVDARSDVFAAGATLFACVTGSLLREVSSIQALADRAARQQTPSPATLTPFVPPELGAILGRCLARAPERRFQDAGQLRDALAAWVAAESRPSC
jgi:eukaryotic-like serine/threonine-protein kinase